MERRGKTRDGREILLTEAHRYFIDRQEKISNGKLLEVSGLAVYPEDAPDRDYYMAFGNAMHEWAEIHLLGWEDRFVPDPQFAPHLKQLALWMSMSGAVVKAVETPRYSEMLDCCTTPDLEIFIPKELNEWPSGDWVIDLKSKIHYPHYCYQTAIQSLAIDPIGQLHRGALMLDGSNNIPRLVVHGEPSDYDVVIAAATLYHEKRRRGIL